MNILTLPFYLVTLSIFPVQISSFSFPTTDSIYTRITLSRPLHKREKINLSHFLVSRQYSNNLLSEHAPLQMSEDSSILDSPMNPLVKKIGTTTSKVVAGTFFIVLAYQRDAFMITFFTGSILNSVSSKIFKRILNQERPTGFEDEDSVKYKPSDKGMPSSHAMSLGFIGTYCIIQSWSILGSGLISVSTILGIILYAMISLIYRVQSKLHTIDQIVVGLAFGITNGFLWHSLCLGYNPFLPSVNLIEILSMNLLPENGIMPITYLSIPAAVGAAVVGSFERRLSSWLKKKKNTKED